MGRFRKSSYTQREFHKGRHRFEHWYRDNTVYFITSRVSDRSGAFASDDAKRIFWDRFDFYSEKYGFESWVRTLLSNHYHLLGYLRTGENLGPLMQRLHGSVSKLVNDVLPVRIVPFWRTKGNKDYFDGCIRDQVQLTRAHKYTCLQAVRAGLVNDYRDYPNTIVDVGIEEALRRASELNVYLPEVPYKRYDRRGRFSNPA